MIFLAFIDNNILLCVCPRSYSKYMTCCDAGEENQCSCQHTYIYIYCFYIYVFDDIKIIDLYRIICFLLLPFYSCGKYLAAICFEDRFAGGQISVGTLSITLTNTAGVVLLMQTLEGF